MDLNDFESFSHIDRENMLAHIDGLPAQFTEAWKLGCNLPLVAMQPVSKVVVAGMGGSAIGADLLAAFLADRLRIPFVVHRDYDLPAFAFGKDTLVVASSHSGNTEEVLSAFEMALQRDCQVVALSTGGKLEEAGIKAGVPVWKFHHIGQPRTAVGYSFGLLLGLLTRIGLVEDLSSEVATACEVMTSLQDKIKAELPVLQNPAKRQAGQFIGRHVTVFGSGFMAPVARRWKTQLNEVAKAFAGFEYLPEADHNTLTGISNPEEQIYHEFTMFLSATQDHPRNQARVEKTRDILMLEGVSTDTFTAKGDTRLAQMWSTLLFGDYVAYYLALAYDTDPTPIPPIIVLKERMSE